MSKKMTKQVAVMVMEVNEYLKAYHIKDETDSLFSTMNWMLLRAGCYHGYNYFTADGKLSGGINEKFDHLEFYIVRA